jgi:hypothetical protein
MKASIFMINQRGDEDVAQDAKELAMYGKAEPKMLLMMVYGNKTDSNGPPVIVLGSSKHDILENGCVAVISC